MSRCKSNSSQAPIKVVYSLPSNADSDSNRILFYKGQRIHADKLGLILSKSNFRRHKLHRGIEYASTVVELPGHDPCLFVAAKNFREDEPDEANVRMKYLIASNPCWHALQLQECTRHVGQSRSITVQPSRIWAWEITTGAS